VLLVVVTLVSGSVVVLGFLVPNIRLSINDKIKHKDNILTIEKLSDIKANIEARIVNIIGRVVGNINANEKPSARDPISVYNCMTIMDNG
jgi:ABC-type enterochelin transport system permease subunit